MTCFWNGIEAEYLQRSSWWSQESLIVLTGQISRQETLIYANNLFVNISSNKHYAIPKAPQLCGTNLTPETLEDIRKLVISAL